MKNELNKALKQEILEKAQQLGANLVNVADVDRWKTYPIVNEAFWPQKIWPWSTRVIVLGIQLFIPIIETTPSAVYSELYNTTNRVLDDISYLLANYINQKGYRAFYFPRDCYGDISVLIENPAAAFSHVLAGYYSGMGTIGYNHTLITPAYGPRLRLVSVITDAPIEADDMMEKNLCTQCKLCEKKCPNHIFSPDGDNIIAHMDKVKCSEYHAQLKQEYHYPCGICACVCPVGEDRKLYGSKSVSDEGIAHCQAYGSLQMGSKPYKR